MRTHLLAAALAVAVTALLPGVASATEDCLGCHTDGKHSLLLGDGTRLSVDVDEAKMRRGPHRKLDCVDCHDGYLSEDHPDRTFADERALKVELARACAGECHEQEGLHAKMTEGLEGTICTDCHGGHGVERVDEKLGCLGCHQHHLQKTLGDGSKVSLLVDPDELHGSVHESLSCEECHSGYEGEEHPIRAYANARELTAAKADACKSCHFDKYTRTLEGIHFEQSVKGDPNAPTCVDCHGAHGTASGSEEKVRSARRCERCHEEVYAVYEASVHGAALLQDGNLDVPVCSDCHPAHDTADPRTNDFANRTPELCGRCHGDAALMAGYGLSTAVLDSYLDDFHGVTASMYAEEGSPRRIAVCTDCHGIHDIRSTRGEPEAVVKANLLTRCQKCHPDAREGFPDAWLSHYEPSWNRASLVWAVDLGYRFLNLGKFGLTSKTVTASEYRIGVRYMID